MSDPTFKQQQSLVLPLLPVSSSLQEPILLVGVTQHTAAL